MPLSPPAPAPAPRSAAVVLVLSLLLGLQPVTTDLYLPALPTLTQALGGSAAQAQLTLSALLLAFGLSQLVWGPLSDRFGRKPILLAGLGLYVLAATGALLAPSLSALITWRTLQGAAMGAAVMAARAIVRDLCAPEEAARLLSKALSGLGLIAALSAPLGGLLVTLWNWRVALAALALFGAASLAAVALLYRESLPPARRSPPQPRAIATTAWTIVRHPAFGAYALLASASYAGLFTFLAASSFVFIEVLGTSRIAYGMALLSMATSYIGGTIVCRRLIARLGVQASVRIAGWLSLCGGSLMGILPLLGVVTPLAILLPFCLYMVGHGIHQPCGQAGAVAPFPNAAGTASALSGLLMMLVAFGVGQWLGWRLDGTVTPLVHGVWFWSACVSAIAWTLVQRHGHLGAAAPAAPSTAASARP